jgi:HEAT repeat protein
MEPAEILAKAIRLAVSDGSQDSDEYWEQIRTLHRNPEQRVFDLAAACCIAAAPAERVVGAHVLAQLGFASESDEAGRRPFTEQSAPVLRAMLSDPNDEVLEAAIQALGHHSIGRADDLRELARHASWHVRDAVAFALDSDDAASRDILLELINDPHDGVRDWATFSIGTQTDADTPQIREALERRLTDSDEETRGEAMVGLARRGDLRVVGTIVAALVENPLGLVVEAAEILLERHPGETRLRQALATAQSSS